MNLTFNECVKLLWIYFGIKTGLCVVGVILQTIPRLLDLINTEAKTQYIEEAETNHGAIIETEQSNSRTEKRRVIGFVSNKMEET